MRDRRAHVLLVDPRRRGYEAEVGLEGVEGLVCVAEELGGREAVGLRALL